VNEKIELDKIIGDSFSVNENTQKQFVKSILTVFGTLVAGVLSLTSSVVVAVVGTYWTAKWKRTEVRERMANMISDEFVKNYSLIIQPYIDIGTDFLRSNGERIKSSLVNDIKSKSECPLKNQLDAIKSLRTYNIYTNI